jgi:hypothetical protein
VGDCRVAAAHEVTWAGRGVPARRNVTPGRLCAEAVHAIVAAMTESQADVQEAIDRERSLFRPEVRGSVERVEGLLDPEFTEIGASGRFWARDAMVAALTRAFGHEAPTSIADSEMTGRLLAPGVVLLTYVSGANGSRARRSSIWRRHADGMRVVHHQGTPLT